MRRAFAIVLFVLVVVSGVLTPAAASGGKAAVRAAACSALRDPEVMRWASGSGEIHLRAVCSGTIDDQLPSGRADRAAPRDGATPVGDLLVNNRSTDTFPDVTQSETSIGVHDGTMVLGFNDSALSKGFTGYARSTDGGTSWTDMGGLPMPLGAVATADGDPMVVADRNRLSGQTSVFYFASIGTKGGDGRSIVPVYRSDDGGATWSFGRNASPLAPATDKLQDKEWLAVDTRASGTGAGNVYVCWRRFGGANGIQFSRSTDNGLTFTQRSTKLSASATNVQSCQVAVSPLDGAVYVSWLDATSETPEIHVRTSTDQGAHFFAEKVISESPDAESQVVCDGQTRDVFLDTEANASQRAIRSETSPSMIVNPLNGNIDVVWHAAELSGGSKADIAFSRSTDGGTTWSPAARINSTVTGLQFFPSIAANQNGELRVAYYSTQNSSTDRKLDLYEVTSTDGGATWSQPDRVTDVSFDRPQTKPNFNPGVAQCYMGDYVFAVAAAPGLGDTAFSMAWGDNRLDGDPGTSGVQPDPDIRFERRVRAASSGGVSADFDHDGFPDLAVGSPGEGVLSIKKIAEDIGAVHVIYGLANGLSGSGSQEWTQDSSGVLEGAETGDVFGSALAAGDFNGDLFDDLAVGVPGEDLTGTPDAGAVGVLYGGSSGLQSASPDDQVWTQNGKNVNDASEAGDRFGAALAVGDFNHDGFDDLAVGVPGEDIPAADAGAVNVLYGGLGGLQVTSPADQVFWQDAPGIQGSPESGDGFGSSLAAGDMGNPAGGGAGLESDLAIGAPGEDVGSVSDAGAVNVIFGTASGLSSTGNQIWDQDESLVGDSCEAGDRFGTAVAVGNFGGAGTRSDLAVGIPGEELGTGVVDSGAVQAFYATDAGLGTDNQQIFDQDFPADVDGARESGDLFGSSLAAGQLSTGQADLAIGSPGEDGGSIVDSGAVNVIYGGTGGLQLTSPADQLWDQDSANVDGQDEAHDLFGSSLTISGVGRTWLAVGVPWEAVGTVARAGAVNILYGGASGLQTASPVDQIWDQDSSGIPDASEAGDVFGAAVG
jgi:hypothetical protein